MGGSSLTCYLRTCFARRMFLGRVVLVFLGRVLLGRVMLVFLGRVFLG